MKPILLASGSPRRKQILEQAGYSFTVRKTDMDESFPLDLSPYDVAPYLSEKKAACFADLSNEYVVLAADTCVIVGNEIINKPDDLDDAKRMLEKLSGRQHTVVSGVTLLSNGVSQTLQEQTLVYFRRLEASEIDFYVETYQPLDKAGAYGIQEWIGLIGVSRIEGDFYNVMGLPICRVKLALDMLL